MEGKMCKHLFSEWILIGIWERPSSRGKEVLLNLSTVFFQLVSSWWMI
jgi:hypothetical protein